MDEINRLLIEARDLESQAAGLRVRARRLLAALDEPDDQDDDAY
jgi:hypothetical protein